MVQVRTFAKRSGNFRQLAESLQREVLEGMVNEAVKASAVDTAAYVDSFGFNNPPGFSSKDRFRIRPGPTVDPQAAKERTKSRLRSEVASLPLDGPVVFANNAPHAGIVEELYFPFAIARREFRAITRNALQRVRSQG